MQNWMTILFRQQLLRPLKTSIEGGHFPWWYLFKDEGLAFCWRSSYASYRESRGRWDPWFRPRRRDRHPRSRCCGRYDLKIRIENVFTPLKKRFPSLKYVFVFSRFLPPRPWLSRLELLLSMEPWLTLEFLLKLPLLGGASVVLWLAGFTVMIRLELEQNVFV